MRPIRLIRDGLLWIARAVIVACGFALIFLIACVLLAADWIYGKGDFAALHDACDEMARGENRPATPSTHG